MKQFYLRLFALLLAVVMALALAGMAEETEGQAATVATPEAAEAAEKAQESGSPEATAEETQAVETETVQPEAVQETQQAEAQPQGDAGELATENIMLFMEEEFPPELEAFELTAPEDTEGTEGLILASEAETSEENDAVDIVPKASQAFPAEIKLGIQQRYTLQVKGKNLKFKSSKAKIASVDKKGIITAKKKGSAVITVTSGKKTLGKCKVKVVDAPKKVYFGIKTLSIGLKESVQLEPKITAGTMASFTWKSKSIKTVSVTKDGKIKGLKKGKTTITVTTQNGKKAKLTVKVVAAPKKVTLNKKQVSLNAGDSFQLKASLPKGTASRLKWSSSKNRVATVNDKGVVTAIGSGTTIITVKTFNNKKAKCTVTVKNKKTKDIGSMTAEEIAQLLGMSLEEFAQRSGKSIESLKGMKGQELIALPLITDGIRWRLNEGCTGVVILGITEPKSSVAIAARYGNYPVFEIGESAFEGDVVLENITLPDSVERIGKRAFANCCKMKKMN